MNIRKLIIEDVRCFAGRQEFNIRPLTFLVGENSTGKTTVLGCFETLYALLEPSTMVGADSLNFNTEPYQMGAFTDIVRRSNPRKKRFRLGFVFQSDIGSMEYVLECIERERGSEPAILEERFVFENGEIIFGTADPLVRLKYRPFFSEQGQHYPRKNECRSEVYRRADATILLGRRKTSLQKARSLAVLDKRIQDEFFPKSSPARVQLQKFLENSRPVWDRVAFPVTIQSFAPIRSKPQRTYDPLKETVSPEGNEMPMLLVNMSKTDDRLWRELKRHLIEFGKASGLFADIDVRRLGKSVGDPFQLQIKVKGPKVNLIDVGYGVNQLLPILIRVLNEYQRATFLMQQPEVHLHPRGQAEFVIFVGQSD